MSECVVRMEMPINCLECPMYDWNRQKLCCNAHFDLRPIPNGGVPKPDWCPIICQLPEGHGRLVDKDEMLKKIENYHRYMTVGRESDPRCIIEDAPTIVPAEAESPLPNPTDPLPIRGVEYVPIEVDVKTGTVTYELRERIEL